MMETYGYELEEEFNAVAHFINQKYGINIKTNEQSVDFTKASLTFMFSVKIWKNHLSPYFEVTPKTEMYFQEILSNAIHIILLGNIDMKIPTLIMLRRTQELILTYIYYSEHPVELYKKEMDDNSRTIGGFNDLKEYVKNYPFSMKYNLEDKKLQELMSMVIGNWTTQYRELSNYVHGTNSNFFQKTQYVDEFKFVKKDINFLTKQVSMLSSTVNVLLIIFYFKEYVYFDEHTEKSLIRNAISNELEYKRKIVEILKEI